MDENITSLAEVTIYQRVTIGNVFPASLCKPVISGLS